MKGSVPAFRCSRCRHTFELEIDGPPSLPALAGDESSEQDREPLQDRELSFTFPAKDLPEATDDHPPAGIVTDAPENQTPRKEIDFQEQWSVHRRKSQDAHAPKDEAQLAFPESTSPTETDKSFDASHAEGPVITDNDASSTLNILPMSSYMDQQASVLPYLTLFALLVIGFSLATVISYAHPKASDEWMKKIPFLGSAVLKNSHLKDGILLQSLRGGYQSIQGNRKVFIITGVALNQNPVVIREIQLTGNIHNEAGKVLEKQTVWVGNTLSVKILRGMTLEDIPHLQSLKPLKSFQMPPGDSVPFAIVFLKATKLIKEFSCAVTFADSEI